MRLTNSFRRVAAPLAGALLGAFAASTGSAQTVKMATLVPDGSSWHQILKEGAEAWKQASNGRVRVNIYPGGVAGDDPDVVRKMRLGILHAGVLTAVGIAEIEPAVYALGVPMMYDSYDELYHVLEKMRPGLEARIAEKGFVVLNWADGGWVHFFTREPAARPEALKKLKLFTWQGDAEAVETWKSAGFTPVPLPATEIATALQTGLVTALGTPPQVAVISQYYQHARNMTDVRWQLLLGGTVISKKVWDRIPADVRPALTEAALESGRRLREVVRASEAEDVAAMQKRGLNVVDVDAAARQEWRVAAERMYPRIRGTIVPADAFDEAMRHRDAYREAQAASGGR